MAIWNTAHNIFYLLIIHSDCKLEFLTQHIIPIHWLHFSITATVTKIYCCPWSGWNLCEASIRYNHRGIHSCLCSGRGLYANWLAREQIMLNIFLRPLSGFDSYLCCWKQLFPLSVSQWISKIVTKYVCKSPINTKLYGKLTRSYIKRGSSGNTYSHSNHKY